MIYRVTHATTYAYEEPASLGYNMAHLTPLESLQQHCLNCDISVQPAASTMVRRTDYFGNTVTFFSIQQPIRRMIVRATSRVELRPRDIIFHSDAPWEEVAAATKRAEHADTLCAFEFSLPSPMVTRSEEFADFARRDFSAGRPWREAALALCARIHKEFRFNPQATTVRTRPEDVLHAGEGVCQDFSHLYLACVRSLGLPARYVSGYLRTVPPPGQKRLVGADVSHAWVSLWAPEVGWMELDPTNNAIVSMDHITVAYGRDYSDVTPVRGVVLGGGTQQVTVSVDVSEEN